MTDSTLLEKTSQTVREFHELRGHGLINKDGEFVSTLQYPPMMRFQQIKEEDYFRGYTPPNAGLFTFYAHLPFCMKRCNFCHIPNIITTSDSEKDVYFDHIDKEMDIYRRRLGLDKFKARNMLLGGGTPTFATPAQLERFLKSYTSRVELGPQTQFTCDIDPLTVIGYEGRERLKILKAYGVNRLSLGAQSFSDDMLRDMNRHHNYADTARAIEQVKEIGFKLEIELIYGYPGETEEHWAGALSQALASGTDEVMIYRLICIPNEARPGAVTRLLDTRENVLKFNENQIKLKAIGYAILEDAGWGETVERSFSKDLTLFSQYRNDFMGCQRETIGFGYYALTMLRDRSAQNTMNLKEYYQAIDENRLPLKTGMIRNKDQQLRRNILMPFENRDLLKEQFLDMTGVPVNEVFGKKIALLKKYGLLEEDAQFLKPTKKGRFFIDDLTQFFFHPEYLPFPKEKYAAGPLNPYLDNEALR